MQHLKTEMNKKYRKVGTHEPVRVLCVDAVGPLPVLYLQETSGFSVVNFLDAQGRNGFGTQVIEEVPAVDWSKVKVDTPIWVKFSTWNRRHFHKFENGEVHYWPDGRTSFTCTETSDTNYVLPNDCSLEEPK